MLNEIRSRMDPWGTPDKIILHGLSVSFMFNPCFFIFKYEYINVIPSIERP